MGYNCAKRKMKKSIIVACTILFTIAFFAFTTPSASNTKISKSTTISMSYVSTVSVCKIKEAGNGGISIVSCNFTGRYDDETGYITIYDSKGREVASGKVRVNNDSRGKRKNYSYCLQNTYFFNL